MVALLTRLSTPNRAAATSDRGSHLGALAELAAAQRADLASTAGLVATVSALSSAYVAGSIYYADEVNMAIGSGIVLMPVPVWLVASFVALATVAMRHRMAVLRLVEHEILGEVDLKQGVLVRKLWSEADDVMERSRARWQDRLAIDIVAVFVTASVLVYSWWAVNLSDPATWLLALTVAGYSVWTITLLVVLFRGDSRLRRARVDVSTQ